MKKQVALAVAAALSLSVAGTALAAPANPFVDVPANHWAYDAVAQLQQTGVIGGYGDGTFRGDRTLTRYELAAIVAKIGLENKDNPLVKKLQSEFGTELYNLGVRVDALEKNASSIKFSGDARIRYQQGQVITKDGTPQASRFTNRVRINMNADVNDKVKFIGRLVAENENSQRYANSNPSPTTKNESFTFDRAEFAYKASDSFSVSVGRLMPNIGQGLIWWNERADGIVATYSKNKFALAAGYVDLTYRSNVATGNDTKDQSINAFVAHLGYKPTDKIGLTVGYSNLSKQNLPTALTQIGGGIQQIAFGADVKFGKDWSLFGEYVQNRKAEAISNYSVGDEQDSGAYARLQYKAINMKQPGTYQIFADYIKIGAQSTVSNLGRLTGDGPQFYYKNDNGFLSDGIDGWGVGFRYVVAKNVNWGVGYYDLESFSGRDKFNNTWQTDINFMF